MAYSLNTTGILGGKTVHCCLLVDDDGTTIKDLAGSNTITHGTTLSTGTWLSGGASIPNWRATSSTNGVVWTAYPAARTTGDVTYYIFIHSTDDGGGVPEHRALLTLLNAGASARINIQAFHNPNRRLCLSTGATVAVSRTDDIPSSSLACAFKVNVIPGGTCTLGQAAGGGASAPTTFDVQTPSDSGASFGSSASTRLDNANMVNTGGYSGARIFLILGVVGGLSGAEETTLLADPIAAVTGGGGGSSSVPLGVITPNQTIAFSSATRRNI